jgi:Zn-dependent M28 family amino/carboxypeptidase
MKRFAGKLRHTVRFGFFNAEEVGIVGSQAYAAAMAACGAPIRGVVCMDMVGWDSDEQAYFEIHAGHGSTPVRDSSVVLADAIRAWGDSISGLDGAQVYSGQIGSEGADRMVYDPAIGRSDHASFQDQGFPAVVVSEDFFMNTAAESSRDRNPHYHRDTDTTVNAAYGARIACAVARAVRGMAVSA